MISLFRDFAKSKWAAGLFALIILSFLIVGAQSDVFSNLGPRHVIDAGDRSVDSVRFRGDFERERASLQEEAGRPVSFDDMVAENLHTRYLEVHTQRLGFLDWAWKAGIRPGKELIFKEIRRIPAFFNQITGQFDQDLYEQALAQQNLTSEMLEQDLRDQYIISQFSAGVFAGARVPRIYGALLAGQALETRDGKWFTLTPAMVGATPAPTEEQLTAFIKENEAQLRMPEFRTASIVLFTPGANESLPAVSEERINERFEFKKDSLSQPERRTFVTLTVPTRAAADQIAADLRAGKAVSEVATANKIQAVPYRDTPRSAVGDPAIATGVFDLNANQVSDPIQGRVGFTVAQVTGISAAAPATLANVRPQLLAELRAEDVKAAAYAKVEKFEAARNEGKSIADAAAAAGARIITLPPFTKEGQMANGQPLNAPRQVLDTTYTLSKGGESDLIDAGEGQYFAVRLDDIRPSALPELAEIRQPLTQMWMQRETQRRISTKAEELAQRVRGGEAIATVAASVNAPLVTRTGVQQSQDSQAELGDAVLRGLFGQGKGQVFSGAGQNGYVIGQVDAITPADPAVAAPLVEQIRPRLTQDLANGLAQQAVISGAARTKATNDPAAALNALGIDPATASAPRPQ